VAISEFYKWPRGFWLEEDECDVLDSPCVLLACLECNGSSFVYRIPVDTATDGGKRDAADAVSAVVCNREATPVPDAHAGEDLRYDMAVLPSGVMTTLLHEIKP
jgi:hypothetical protein